jgi:uncharacterized membrane protein (DUF485 family)
MSASTPAGPTTDAPPDAPAREAAGTEAPATHDWAMLAKTPEFQELHRNRRRFTLTGMFIQTGALLGVMALLGFAPDAMGKPAIGAVTWALVAGAGLVVLTFLLALAYSAKSRSWERLAAAAIAHGEQPAQSTRRFAR